MLLSAIDGDKKLSDHISGVILNHETFYQSDDAGNSFVEVLKDQGIVAGIKVCTLHPLLTNHAELILISYLYPYDSVLKNRVVSACPYCNTLD